MPHVVGGSSLDVALVVLMNRLNRCLHITLCAVANITGRECQGIRAATLVGYVSLSIPCRVRLGVTYSGSAENAESVANARNA